MLDYPFCRLLSFMKEPSLNVLCKSQLVFRHIRVNAFRILENIYLISDLKRQTGVFKKKNIHSIYILRHLLIRKEQLSNLTP